MSDNSGTMERSIEDGRWNATFRPRRLVRFSATAFLAAWFCLWAVGEIYAIGILSASLGLPGGQALLNLLGLLGGALVPAVAERMAWREFPSPANAGPFELFFIASWLTVWTLAGLMAAWQVLRLHASEDRVEWDDQGVALLRRVGPFRSRRSWRAEQIEHVSLSRSDRALLLHTARATRVLTEWGSRPERSAVRDELRQVLGLPQAEPGRARGRAADAARAGGERTHAAAKPRPAARGGRRPVLTLVKGTRAPAGWAASPLADGGTRLVRDPAARLVRAAAAWTAMAACAAATTFLSGGGLDMLPGALLGPLQAAGVLVSGLLAAGGVWLTFVGTEILVREGAVEVRRGFLGLRSIRTLESVRLSVEHTTDSDGDDWFELQARSGGERLTLDLRMNESRPVLELARWIAGKSGSPLDLGRGVEDAEDETQARAA